MKTLTELKRLAEQLRRQGPILTFWAGVDKGHRWIRGGPWSRFSRITDEIWLGGQPAERAWPRLFERGISGVVNMRSEHDYEHELDVDAIRYLQLPTDDNEAPKLEHLSAGVDFIRREVGRGGKVYIHCWEGLGRGPTMAAAYFVSQGCVPEDAWDQIREVRPFVRPTDGQLERLREFARQYEPDKELTRIEARSGVKTVKTKTVEEEQQSGGPC